MLLIVFINLMIIFLFYQPIIILEDGNNILYLIFYLLHIFKKFILKILVELPFHSTSTLNFHAELEINGIVYIIKIIIILY